MCRQMFIFGGKHDKRNLQATFQRGEIALWLCSELIIIFSNIFIKSDGYLSLIASVIGVTALIFNAKGNPIGPGLMIFFALIYGYISYTFSYYGEMLTYVCMSLPMAVVSLISWLKNPYKGNKAEVTINFKITKRELVFLAFLALAVTTVFLFYT